MVASLAACATPGGDSGEPSRSPARTGSAGASSGSASGSSAGASGASSATAADPRDKDLPTETVRPTGKADWVAVYETPPGTRYGDQRVIYVDRASVQPNKVEKLTYFLARTREVSPSSARAKVQELAVICEGTPMAPATSLRGEGTEDGSGNISMKRVPGGVTSVSQFSTQRVRADANNPNTFIVRAICLLGLDGRR